MPFEKSTQYPPWFWYMWYILWKGNNSAPEVVQLMVPAKTSVCRCPGHDRVAVPFGLGFASGRHA